MVFEGLEFSVSEAVAEANHIIQKVVSVLNRNFHFSDCFFPGTSNIGAIFLTG